MCRETELLLENSYQVVSAPEFDQSTYTYITIVLHVLRKVPTLELETKFFNT